MVWIKIVGFFEMSHGIPKPFYFDPPASKLAQTHVIGSPEGNQACICKGKHVKQEEKNHSSRVLASPDKARMNIKT